MMSGAITVAVANAWKGGSVIGGSFSSSCCRSRPLFLSYRQLKRNANGNYLYLRNANGISLCYRQVNPLGCCKPMAAAVTARRLLCTVSSSSNATDSSSAVPTTSATAAPFSATEDPAAIKNAANTLDIRVGKILKAWRHEDADSLYVEEVDVGEPEPRIICSGLVKYMPLDHLQDKKVVVLANLKPRNMRGVKSNGMLMAASDASHENVELLVPPEDSLPGERVWFGYADERDELPDVAAPNQVQKKRIWELVQPHLQTDSSCVAVLATHFMRTAAGVVMCRSLQNGKIS